MESESIYKCLTCFACVERCPRGVEPAKVVEAVRLEVIRQQGKNRLKQDDIPGALDEDTPGQLLMTAMRKYAK
jgi:heterodisulfide reductase subunit C